MTKKEQIQQIHAARKDSNENSHTLAGMLEATIHTGFHDPHKFVYEILQNANDADASKVTFTLAKNYLIIQYDGKPFRKEDVKRICDASTHSSEDRSSKTYDQSKIGYKGIGFKSVFCIAEKVTVISNGYQFCFDKTQWKNLGSLKHPWQIIPIWVELDHLQHIPNLSLEETNVTFILEIFSIDFRKIQTEIKKYANNMIQFCS